MTIEANNNLKTVEYGNRINQLWFDDDAATVMGQRIVDALGLKPDQNGKYKTARGSKSLSGIVRTVLDVVDLG